MVSVSQNTDLTPQESEQLSQYAADDQYVQQQKEDILELASMFRGMMGKEKSSIETFAEQLKNNFKPLPGFKARIRIVIDGKRILAEIAQNNLSVEVGSDKPGDVEITLSQDTMNEIVNGRMTFQRAFMSGAMTMKGDFQYMRSLDELFEFMK